MTFITETPAAGAARRTTRRVVSTGSAIALALGLVTAIPAHAQDLEGEGGDAAGAASSVISEVKDVALECVEHQGLRSNGSGVTISPNAFEVSYPERVQPGETFTVTVQPGPMSTGDKATGRMKLDYALPQGVQISNLRIVEEGTNLNDSPAAVVQRVNAAGQPDENGEFARIWDGANSVNNGGNENDNWSPGFLGIGVVPRAGVAVEANTEFRLPKIAFDVTAPETSGVAIRTGLRAADEDLGPASKANTNNAISMLARSVVTDAVYCHANAAGRALTNTIIAQGTETTLQHTRPDVELDADVDVLPGDMIRFIATVTAGDSQVPEGSKVVFYEGEDAIGEAEVNPATGEAVLDYAFATRGDHEVRAEFQEVEEKAFDGTVDAVWEQSESAPVTITVSAFGFDIDNPEPVLPEDEEEDTGLLGSVESLISGSSAVEGGEGDAEGSSALGSSGELQWWHKLLIVLGSLGAIFGIGTTLLQFLPKHR